MNKKKLAYAMVGLLTISGLQLGAMQTAEAATTWKGKVGIDFGALLFGPGEMNASGVGIGIGTAGAQALLPGALPGMREGEESPYFKEGALAVVKGKEGYGLIGLKGEEIIAPTNRAVIPQANGNFKVEVNKKTTIYKNAKGQEVGPEEQPMVEGDLTAYKDDKSRRYGFKNANGDIVIEPAFKKVEAPFSEGIAFVRNNDGKIAAIDTKGAYLFTVDADSIEPYKDGLAEVRRNVTKVGVSAVLGLVFGNTINTGHYKGIGATAYDGVKRGFIDREGNVIIDSHLDKVYPMTPYGVVIEDDDKVGFMNREGKYIIAPGNFEASTVNITHGVLSLKDKKSDLYGAYSMKNGALMVPFQYKKLDFLTHGLVALKTDKDIEVVDMLHNNDVVFRLSKDAWFNNFGDAGYMWVKKDTSRTAKDVLIGKGFDGYKVIDLKGDVQYEAKDVRIEDVSVFRHGYSAVKVDGKWGIMDAKGQWVVKPMYQRISLL